VYVATSKWQVTLYEAYMIPYGTRVPVAVMPVSPDANSYTTFYFTYYVHVLVRRIIAMCFQAKAALLKTITSGGSRTKVIALGIGAVDESELRDVASSPQDRNVILVQQFSDLPTVEGQLRHSSCTGKNV